MKTHFLYCLLLLLAAWAPPAFAQMQAASAPAVQESFAEITENLAAAPSTATPALFEYQVMRALPDNFAFAPNAEAGIADEALSQKWLTVQQLYLRKSEVTVGFGSTHTEVMKPAIFDSLTRIEKHFRKAARKGEVPEAEAAKEISKYLDLGYLLFYASNTENLEQALRQAKAVREQINLFDAVRFAP